MFLKVPTNLEPRLPVQTDRRHLRRIADYRHHLAKSPVGAVPDQGVEQRPAEPAPLHRMPDVHRILHRVAIGRASAIGTGVGVSAHVAVALGDEPGVPPLQQHVPAPAHLGLVRRHRLEARGAGLDVMRVNCGDRRHVGVAGRANRHGFHGWSCSIGQVIIAQEQWHRRHEVGHVVDFQHRMAGLATPSHEKVRRHEGGFPGCAGFQPATGRRPAIVHAGWKPAHPGTLLLVCVFSQQQRRRACHSTPDRFPMADLFRMAGGAVGTERRPDRGLSFTRRASTGRLDESAT